jgi:hypothetical protein
MKKFKLLSAIAMAGLLGLSAHAAVNNYDLVNVKLTVLVQTNTDITDGTKFKALKTKVVNKDILKLISEEYTNMPAITNKGAQLAVDDFFDGDFEVVSNGTILLDHAGEPANIITNDAYQLSFTQDGNEVDTGSQTETVTESKDSEKDIVVTSLLYSDAAALNTVEVDGSATVSDNGVSTEAADKGTESFKFSGVGNGFFGEDDAVVTGTVSGSGKFSEF